MTRSTAQAGRLQAGDTLDKPDDLLALLDGIATTKAGVAALDALNAQLADAEQDEASHAAGAENAQLRGEQAEQHHVEVAGVKARRSARIRVAIDRATERLATVAEQERCADGEAAAARAAKAAIEIENLVAQYVTTARAVGDLLEKIAIASSEMVRERTMAREVGVVCDAELPHESRFVPERTEEREVIDRNAGPMVTDAAGRPLDSKPIRYTETRRREMVIVQHRHAPRSILDLRAVLPSPDGGNIVDRGRD